MKHCLSSLQHVDYYWTYIHVGLNAKDERIFTFVYFTCFCLLCYIGKGTSYWYHGALYVVPETIRIPTLIPKGSYWQF